MNQELIIAIIALVFSGASLYINILYRRKDFYNQLLKEQIAAAYFIMESLLKLNNSFNEGYKTFVGKSIARYLEKHTGQMPDENLITLWQTELFVNLESEFLQSLNSVLARGFIFPVQFQKELRSYFDRIANLFENNNNEALGIRLRELYLPLTDLTNKLNRYLKIDKLSKQLNKLL